MSIFERKIKDGWWKDRFPAETTIPLDQINWDELIKQRSTIVHDESGVPFKISIPNKPAEEIRESDLKIEQLPIPLPKVARPN